MAETNPCKCATASAGPTKATAASFKFQVCDGDELVSVSASQVADYVINVIYGDAQGDPPAEGCYSVCYDGGGNRTISVTQDGEDGASSSYDLLEEHVIWPIAPVDPDTYEAWGRGTTRTFDLIQPPAGFVPTHVRLRVWANMGGDGEVITLRDANGNRVFHMLGFNDNDDHSSFAEVALPVQVNGSSEYELYLTGDQSSGAMNIKQVGYEQRGTFNSDGDVTTPIGGTNPEETETAVVVVPLNITHLSHTYNAAGADQTIIEWFYDDTLIVSDNYSVSFDLGDTIHTELVPHVVSADYNKQRLTVNWNTDNTIKIDAVVSQGGSSGNAVTSNFGTSDTSIPVSFETSVTI